MKTPRSRRRRLARPSRGSLFAVLIALMLLVSSGLSTVILFCINQYGVFWIPLGYQDLLTSPFCIPPGDVTPVCTDPNAAGGTSGLWAGNGSGGGSGFAAGESRPAQPSQAQGGADPDSGDSCCINESGPGGPGSPGRPGSPGCGSCGRPIGTVGIWAGDGMYSQKPGIGMPVWRVSEPKINLWLRDKPLFYQTSRGVEVSFRLNYKNVAGDNGVIDTAQPAIFGVGTNWHSPWRSYLQQTNTTNCLIFLGDGSARRYLLTSSSATNLEYYSRGRLYIDSSNRFCLELTTGKTLIYADTNTVGGLTNVFLSQVREAEGHLTQFSYTNLSNAFRLVQVTDTDGNQTTFGYTDALRYSNLITQVNGPFGLTAVLTYNTNGQLINIKDVMNLESQIGYDSNNRLSTLATPYGTNTFAYYASGNSTNWTALRVTELGVRQTLYLEGATNSNILPSAASEFSSLSQFMANSGLSETFEDSKYTDRNTVLWGPRQYANLPSGVRSSLDNGTFDASTLTTNDYQKGRLRHWLFAAGMAMVSPTLSLERAPSPNNDGSTEGLLTWFDYPHKTDRNSQGTSLPLAVANRNPGGPWRISYTDRNSLGKITSHKQTYSDPAGNTVWRTNTFDYATNKIDLTKATTIDETVNYGYNDFHEVLAMTNAINEVTTYAYNANHQLTNQVNPSGLITDILYDSNSWPTSYVARTDGGVFFRTNSYTYANGLVLTHTDPRGLTVTFVYDAFERLLKRIYPDGTGQTNVFDKMDLVLAYDRLGFTNGFAYDGFRQLLRRTNANTKVTSYQYCDCGSLNSITDPLVTTTSFSYDNLGQQIGMTYPDNSFSVTYSFDLLGRVTNIVDSAGSSVTNWLNLQGLTVASSNSMGRVQALICDIHDRIITNIDANGVATVQTFDDLGRVLTRAYPDGGVEGFLYSTNGLIAYTNQLGNVTRYAYDATGRKTGETNANNEVTQFSYGPAGDLLTLTDAKTNITSWKYDEYGRVTNKFDAATNLIFAYTYDANNRLRSRWTPAKGTNSYVYDAVGNLTTNFYPVNHSISLAYDGLNRVISMVDGIGTTVYAFTSGGLLQSEDGPWASDTVTYTYQNRLRTGLNLQQPNASDCVQTYGYDGAKRLKTLTSPAGEFDYAYDPTRQMQVGKLSLPNGAFITNTFDGVSRMLSTVLKNSTNGIVNSHSYAYNVGNQRSCVTNTLGEYRTYGYDSIGQLTMARGFESNASSREHEKTGYTYDPAGNLMRRTNNALVETFNVNSLNELTTGSRSGTLTVAGTTTSPATNVTVNTSNATRYADNTFSAQSFTLADGTNTFTAIAKDTNRTDSARITAYLPASPAWTYDLNGNLLSDGRRAFDYDDENQLIRVTVTNSFKSEFNYDGKMRRRIRREYAWQLGAWRLTNEVHYVYDGNLVIQERDAMNLPIVTYTRGKDLSGSLEVAGGIGGLLAMADLKSSISNPHYFYHADANGNVTMLINSVQLPVAKYLYDPFGRILSSSGPLAGVNLYLFSSKEAHPALGLAYYIYRYYDENLQRWLNRDPIEEDGGINLYGFIENNSMNLIDTDGLAWWPPSKWPFKIAPPPPPSFTPCTDVQDIAACYNVCLLQNKAYWSCTIVKTTKLLRFGFWVQSIFRTCQCSTQPACPFPGWWVKL